MRIEASRVSLQAQAPVIATPSRRNHNHNNAIALANGSQMASPNAVSLSSIVATPPASPLRGHSPLLPPSLTPSLIPSLSLRALSSPVPNSNQNNNRAMTSPPHRRLQPQPQSQPRPQPRLQPQSQSPPPPAAVIATPPVLLENGYTHDEAKSRYTLDNNGKCKNDLMVPARIYENIYPYQRDCIKWLVNSRGTYHSLSSFVTHIGAC
jgi:hypothetical protein